MAADEAVPFTGFPRSDAAHAVKVQRASELYAQGKKRASANAYLEAYNAVPRRWKGRHYCLSGYTSIMLNQEEPFTDADMAALKSIANNGRNPTVDTVLAFFARGLGAFDRADRKEAVRMYARAIEAAERATPEDRSLRVLTTTSTGAPVYQPARVIIDSYCEQARTNKARLHRHEGESQAPQGATASVGKNAPSRRVTLWPIRASSAEGAVREQHRQDAALRVRSDACAAPLPDGGQCGRGEGAEGGRLKQCSRCKLVWYCSSECQRRHWKAGHKQVCRPEKDFRAEDIVRLHGLAGEDQELQPHFFEVVGRDPAQEQHWLVRHGYLLPGGPKSVHESNMSRVLTS